MNWEDAAGRGNELSGFGVRAIYLISSLIPLFLSVDTPAVDVIHGGVKSNAIPEWAEAIVHHRVATHSSISELKEEYLHELTWLAADLDLQLFAWGEEIKELQSNRSRYDSLRRNADRKFIGKLFIEAWSEELEPAPSTPFSSNLSDAESKAWRLLSGVIRNVWRVDESGEELDGEGEGILVAPSLMQGNTDTQK